MEIREKTLEEIDETTEIENMKKIEAALFLSARFISLKDLVLLTDINPLMLKELIEKLMSMYNTEESAIEIINKENMWKMDVRQEYFGMVNKLATGSSEFTKAEQETLAVIAYKQPVKQSVIIKIRGNKAYDHIKNFIEIGLVQAKKIGHTKELTLSDDFFDYFNLQNSKERVLNGHENSEQNFEGEEFSDLQKGEKGFVIEKNIEDSDIPDVQENLENDHVEDENGNAGENLENLENSDNESDNIKLDDENDEGEKEGDE